MSKPLIIDDKALAVMVDMAGRMVADVNQEVKGNDNVTWDLNQATIALQHAYDLLTKEV